jgi:integrase
MLTARQIEAAIKNVETEITLNDGSSGRRTGSLKLVIRKGANGVSASWYSAWKLDGRRQKKMLGRFPELSLAAARQMHAAETTPFLQQNRNPKAVARIVKPTVQALFEAYCDHLDQKGTRTVAGSRYVLLTAGTTHRKAVGKNAGIKATSCADGLGRDRLAADIAPADVAAFLAKAFNRGARRQADIQRTAMAAAFNWGIKSTHDYRTDKRGDWGIKFNPVTAVPKDSGANRARERNLTADELAALWAGMSGERFSVEIASVVKLIICCGQRVQETLRAEGCEIDLKARTWNMPAHKTKGGKHPHSIPLPAQAVAVFQELIDHHGDGPLFPSRLGAKSPYIAHTSVNQAVKRWYVDKGVAPFIPRDLRRTWKSRTADAGIDRFVRDLIQQHAMNDTGSKHYDRADYLPKMREAMQKWEEWLDVNVIASQQHKAAA